MSKILVIEDDILAKDNIIDILREESFEAIDASNGFTGIKLAQEYLPDLILCDIEMPSINGYQVLKNLKKNYLTSSIPFIFLTCKTTRQAWRTGMELGADDYITKPFTPQELLKAIATRLNFRNQQAEQQVNRIAKLERIFHFDSTTNLPSQLSLQVNFEKLVNEHLLANINNLAKNKKIKLDIPIICLQIHNFVAFSQLLSEAQTKSLLRIIREILLTSSFGEGIVTYLEQGTYGIILPSLAQRESVMNFLRRIDQNITLICQDKDFLPKIILNFSLGVSFYPEYGIDLHTLIEQAKMASSIKGDKYAFYQPHRQQKIERSNKFVAKKDLSRALKLEEFKVVYQPQISLKTGIITSCEAILRWQHPLHGDISLAQFISTAEKTDLLVPISLWFLEKTAQQLNHWQQNGFRQLKLAIKIVGVHFYQDNFDLDIANILQKYRLNYGTLTLEMRENTLLQNKLKAQAKLKVMRNLGVNLTLDEFGTGYTNLNYWQEFPFNNIKLDWHRLQSVFKRDRSHQISQASINLAHQQGLKTIVTGIGTTADWQFVAQEKWDLIQGDYLSQPLSAVKFSRLLQINS